MQHLQFGAANCTLPAATHFYKFGGLLLCTVDFANEYRCQM